MIRHDLDEILAKAKKRTNFYTKQIRNTIVVPNQGQVCRGVAEDTNRKSTPVSCFIHFVDRHVVRQDIAKTRFKTLYRCNEKLCFFGEAALNFAFSI